jgi:hypothetical protein
MAKLGVRSPQIFCSSSEIFKKELMTHFQWSRKTHHLGNWKWSRRASSSCACSLTNECCFLLLLLFLYLLICVYIPTPTSRQNLFGPLVLQFCWTENMSDNKKDKEFFLVWDEDRYTEIPSSASMHLCIAKWAHQLHPSFLPFPCSSHVHSALSVSLLT